MARVRAITFGQDNEKSKENEDFLLVSEYKQIYAVADGVSRSRKNGRYTNELSSLPAAKLFCDVVVKQLECGNVMYAAFDEANKAVAKLNLSYGITTETVDYLHKDYVSCGGIVGLFNEEDSRVFSYGFIGDCGILVYDADLFPVFLSENRMGILEHFRDQWGYTDTDDMMIFWRKELRNRNMRFMTYGSLTGQPEAMDQITMGSVCVDTGYIILLFSDGIYPFIFDNLFRWKVRRVLQNGEDNLLPLDRFMRTLTLGLREQKTPNIDDDKTFIAIQVPDSSVLAQH
ncbi:MAG: hypothetical protein U1A25_02890 [Candidatus Sungbacteria bacterium]|nr:hypothetical protein [bacterium]MDZ4260589.1 hypothetical protein [Candidatus Sungbacteria bacterium]